MSWECPGSLHLSEEEGDGEEGLLGSEIHVLDNGIQRAAHYDLGSCQT